ncbi:hypothetical protein D3C76_811890 [compost metagenome]
MLAAIGPVLVARLPFGSSEVAQADAVVIGGRADLVGARLLGDSLDPQIDLAGLGTRHPQGQPAQFHIERTRTPQTATGSKGDLAVGPGGAQQLVIVIELGALRHAAQHQAVEHLAAIAIREGGIDLNRIIDHGRWHQSQLPRALINPVDAIVELHILDARQRLGHPGAMLVHAEIEPAIIGRITRALLDDIVGAVA